MSWMLLGVGSSMHLRDPKRRRETEMTRDWSD